ncbi:MAG: hypothetical protein E7051_02005 [Lentisphaerae bacterium]|nr:hypothetical protein [Lentisphaerota bacterium]MBQ4328534.1 hypothetical protein [Lentisphaeria bacterium]
MIEITNYRQGAILNHRHGIETADSLLIKVEGISDHGCPVTVNGVPAEMDGRRFFAEIPLTEKVNVIEAATVTPYGNYKQALTVVWDKKSFKRYNYYIDDHIFTFTDLAKERPKSAFDHFYLKGLKEVNRKYGTKFTLNCFYHNAHQEFLLKDMPDIWKSEFIDNSDWLKFSFHAYSEFPDRPYAEASAEEIGKDWDMVQNEIYRFAGEASYITPNVIHWANIHPSAAQECIRRGCACYSTTFRLRVMGGPSLADRQKGGNMATVQARSCSGADMGLETLGLNMHYGFGEERNYITNHRSYYDPLLNIFFFSCNATNNLLPLNETPAHLQKVISDAEKHDFEAFCVASHEQYSFPYYPNYLPDHMERIECSARVMSEYGAKPVFFSEGVLGNTVWED